MKIRFALVLVTLCGCSTFQPVKDSAVRHLLEPLVPQRPLSATSPAMAINRASIPSYLDKQQLVTRQDGVLVINDLDIWAEPLDSGISRVMASNLSRLTRSMNIQPVERFITLDYTNLLEVRITQFEPDAANSMVLQGTWKLQPVSGAEAANHFFRIIVPMTSATVMKDRVTAMNQALERLAREIAATL
jgi:uncharacterized lipoprotein YmbA